MSRRRLRIVTLWTGATLLLLIMAAFVVSGWRQVLVEVPYGPSVCVMEGTLLVGIPGVSGEWTYSAYQHSHGFRSWLGFVGWDNGWVIVPLPLMLFVVAVPTCLVWWFGPKPIKPGHCRCGYDLTGLTEPRCPECGLPFEPQSDAP